MAKFSTVLLSLLLIATLLVLPRTAASDFEPMLYDSGSQIAEVETGVDGATSIDTFYTVDVIQFVDAFARIDEAIAKARGTYSEDQVLVTRENMYNTFQSFVSSMRQGWNSGSTWLVLERVRAQGLNQFFDFQKMERVFGNDRIKQIMTLEEMRVPLESAMCGVFSSAFTMTVMDRNGGDWLFSDVFDDEDEDALDRAIAREFEAAYQSTRFYCSVHYEPLLPLFDRFYDRCVGDKLAAFRHFQAK